LGILLTLIVAFFAHSSYVAPLLIALFISAISSFLFYITFYCGLSPIFLNVAIGVGDVDPLVVSSGLSVID
jgi:ABC-type nitrate/sulfonate/bicarbonate transport system permease component